MRNFDKRFAKQSAEFDRDFARMKKWGLISGIFSIAISLGLIGFGIWVVIMVMRFFGIV